MSLKDLNVGTGAPLPKNWTSETRFINYRYVPISIPETPLPQQPATPVTWSQVFKSGVSQEAPATLRSFSAELYHRK
jgi:hypothetical protein